MTYVCSDEKQADAVERVLDHVEAYSFKIELLLVNSGFYNEHVIRRSRETAATVVPVAFLGDRHEKKFETRKSHVTTYQMYKDSERELCFPLAVSVSYWSGDRGKHDEVARGMRRAIAQIARLHKSSTTIGSDRRLSSYRLFRSARAVISTQDPIVGFAFVVVSFLPENLWLVLQWADATCLRSSCSRGFVPGFGTRSKRI